MTQHTAGNWKVGNASSVVTDVRRDREHTDIDERSILFYGGELICESIENKSDARLIAAAPELLEALEELTLMARAWQTDFELLANDNSYKPEFNKETCRAMEVIAKAKGE